MRQQQSRLKAFTAMRGKPVFSSDGKKVGEIENIYYDRLTRQPEWVEVKSGVLGGLIGGKRTLVPVAEAEMQEDGTGSTFIRVPYTKEQIDEVPGIDADQDISKAERDRLHSHYGIPLPPESESPAGQSEEGQGQSRVRKWSESEPAAEEASSSKEEEGASRTEEGRVIGKEIVSNREITVGQEGETRQGRASGQARRRRNDT
jgi:sporulation protein YlmC with PRC-barrel domain